ncbi:MAG TPA: hypothetical protein VGS12_08000 [Caulobacteraceae bacterium]|nr:hypothetical protein [Caulobacteraceae bacterium]
MSAPGAKATDGLLARGFIPPVVALATGSVRVGAGERDLNSPANVCGRADTSATVELRSRRARALQPFEFIILFLSIIYTLALNHLLHAAARMIRYRRRIVFSWPHALWMLDTLVILLVNWLSLWDFAHKQVLSLGFIAGVLGFVIIQYFVCTLVLSV